MTYDTLPYDFVPYDSLADASLTDGADGAAGGAGRCP